MKAPTLRQLAARLSLSTATVSRALHQDRRVRPSTTRRVLRAAKAAGYHLDPLVSTGMSRIRQGNFYRETLAWCGNVPARDMPWLTSFFQSVENYGERLGYGIEYFHFDRADARSLQRLASIWRARGIRGILLGPFLTSYERLPFPWDDFAWVLVGHAVETPLLHSVGRDYAFDIREGLEWLKGKGCKRPCFLLDPEVKHLFREPMLQAALRHYHGMRSRPPAPYFELDARQPGRFRAWLKANRPDGIFLPGSMSPSLRALLRKVADLPTVLLSRPDAMIWPCCLSFTAQYEVIGQSSVNLLHRLLGNRDYGIPAYKHSVLASSKCSLDKKNSPAHEAAGA